MAQVTTRKVVEGLNNLVLHVSMESDGSGELQDYVLLSPADLSPALPARPTFRIMQIWTQQVWFDIAIKFGGITPRPAWVLARDSTEHVDFRSFGGISDYTQDPPDDWNGNLLVSTNDFVLGSLGTLVIEFRKP